jgi:ABC-type branched-subunit amino acid transport system ATPase component
MPVSNNANILTVTHLSAGYGKRQVLFDVSFAVKRGDIVLLIGGNGSGKSTLLKAIYGLVPKWDNSNEELSCESVQFESDNITHTKPFELIQKGLVYVPQKNNTFDQLTVGENLEVASTHVYDKHELIKRQDCVFEKLPQLKALKSRTPFHLSGGEKQQLALGMALMQQPKMIILDEPSAGLAPNTWQQNLDIIKKLNQQGITFLIVEHRVKETASKAHKILIMKLGKLDTTHLNIHD